MTRPCRQHILGLLFTSAVFLLVGILSWPDSTAAAQSGDPVWDDPANLSQSGAADRPLVVVDASGLVHVIWQDAFAGYVYRNGDGQNFGEPQPVEFPFGRQIFLPNGGTARPLFTPVLRADPAGPIHAVWTNNDDVLSYSRVANEEFAALTAWTAVEQLAEAATAYDLAVDEGGALHLVYVRPLNTDLFPAGVYYRRSVDGGDSWSEPVSLFQSPYFRGLSAQDARIGLATAPGGQIVAAWDNRPQERVLVIHSGDGGLSWELPVEVDRRTDVDGEETVGPQDVVVISASGTVHLFWQAGHEAIACGQYHQWSTDGGATWLPRQRILAEFESCPEDISAIAAGDRLLLFAKMTTGVYSMIWSNGQWSGPQRQGVLAGFVNPDTYRPVEFSCRRAALTTDQRLLFVGCDESEANDVWLIAGSAEVLGEVSEPSDQIWRLPQLVAPRGQNERIADPVLIGDGDGFFHAFWSQTVDQVGSVINYARWDGAGWSPPVDVLTSPSGQVSERPAVALAGNDRLLVTWDSGSSGELFFSQTAVATSGDPTEWFAPQAISAVGAVASSPDIVVDQDDTIYVLYAVRLNEDRGVYLVRSEDQGESWSDPFLVFDAVAAGWESVDQPRLVMTGDGVLHAIFLERSVPPENAPLGLFYAASTDNGESWSPADPVPFNDQPAAWGDILGAGFESVFLLWQEDDELESGLWFQFSPNGGLSWEAPSRISDIGNLTGPSSATVNAAGEPQLVQLVSDDVDSRLQHWSWTEGGWTAGETLILQPGQPDGVSGVSAGISTNGGLAVLFAGQILDLETGRLQPGLLASARQVDVVVPTPTPQVVDNTVEITPDGAPAVDETATVPATVAVTPTAVIPLDLADSDSSSGNVSLTTIITVVVVLLVAGVLVLIGLRAFRER